MRKGFFPHRVRENTYCTLSSSTSATHYSKILQTWQEMKEMVETNKSLKKIIDMETCKPIL